MGRVAIDDAGSFKNGRCCRYGRVIEVKPHTASKINRSIKLESQKSSPQINHEEVIQSFRSSCAIQQQPMAEHCPRAEDSPLKNRRWDVFVFSACSLRTIHASRAQQN